MNTMPVKIVRNERGEWEVLNRNDEVLATLPTEEAAWQWYDNFYKSDDW